MSRLASRGALALVAVFVLAAGVVVGPAFTAGHRAGIATTATARAFAAGGRPDSGQPRLLGPLGPETSVDFGLTLKMPNPAAIDAYLAALYEPGSSNYRRFLTAAQFGARFGLPLDRIEGVEAWATEKGLTVLGGFDQRTAIRLRATAAKLTELFGVHLGGYFDPQTGAAFHAPLDAITVLPAIADAVVGLTGLDSRPVEPRFVLRPGLRPADIVGKGLAPMDLAKAYDMVPLYNAGYRGDGQTLAIVSFDTFALSDMTTFDSQFGIDGPPVQRVAIGPAVDGPGRGAAEVTLDIEVARAVAPHAQILDFEAVNGTGYTHGDMIDSIVQDGRADIVSDSWGLCDVDEHFGTGSRERQLRSLQAAGAAGVSIFAPSGDNGAFDCWSRDHTDHRQAVDFPSDSPWTISVGGTVLSVRADGTYLSEVGWEQFLSTSGTGGGLNSTEARPDWQRGPGVDNEFSNGNRQLPDVAAPAGGESPYQIYFTPSDGSAPWTTISGTSAASPFWAGVAVLIRQLAQQQGVGRLGYLNPVLYDLANGGQAGRIFHDVTRGGNLLQAATPGWDYATGWGSPDVTALADAVVVYLRDHPAST